METKKQRKYSINEFYLGTTIGRGNFTTIFKAEEKETKKVYALKQASKKTLQSKNKFGDLLMEKHCLYKLKDCPRVVNISDTFQDTLCIYILMELLEGPELWERIKFYGIVDRNLRNYLMREIALGVQEMHANGIAHRDIKPENIVFNNSMGSIKFVDFGSAKDTNNPNIKGSGNSTTGRNVFHNFVGTPNYMAPECLHDKETGHYSDIFSLGNLYI